DGGGPLGDRDLDVDRAAEVIAVRHQRQIEGVADGPHLVAEPQAGRTHGGLRGGLRPSRCGGCGGGRWRGGRSAGGAAAAGDRGGQEEQAGARHRAEGIPHGGGTSGVRSATRSVMSPPAPWEKSRFRSAWSVRLGYSQG